MTDRSTSGKWSRRKFSKALLSLQAIAMSGILTIPAACRSEQTGPGGYTVSDATKRLLRAVMDELIPGTENMPSAVEAGGVDYVLAILDEQNELIPPFKQMLENIDTKSKEVTSMGFIELESDQRIEVLRSLEKSDPEIFQVLINFVYESYYINEQVWQLIDYEAHPTMSMGPSMEPFDPATLDHIRSRPPFYIDIKT